MKVNIVQHRGKEWIEVKIDIKFPYLSAIKCHKTRKWSQTRKAWLFPVSKENKNFVRKLYNRVKGVPTKPLVQKAIKPKPQKQPLQQNKATNQVIGQQQQPQKPNVSLGNIKKKVHLRILRSNYIKMAFYPGKEILSLLKAWKNCRFYNVKQYEGSFKYWIIPFHPKRLNTLKLKLEEQNLAVVIIDERQKKAKKKHKILADHYRACPEEMVLKLKELRYAESTVKTYASMMSDFLSYYYMYNAKEITHEMIIAYLRYLVMEREVSKSTQNQAINAIKFYYERVLGMKKTMYYIDRPIKERKLPVVLSKEEVTLILKQLKNLKHKTIVSMLYSGGLRRSELLNLKLEHIDYKAKRIFIKGSKGNKDRYVPLSKRIAIVLKKYLEVYAPLTYLIEGIKPGKKYSATSVAKIITKASENVGILKNVTPHTFRHSFATHMIENGVNLRYVQVVLGHGSSKTTEIYTHITDLALNEIENPLDLLDF